MQVSYGDLKSPEQLEPDIRIRRATASITYHLQDGRRPLGNDAGLRAQPEVGARDGRVGAGLAARVDLRDPRHAHALRPRRAGRQQRAVRGRTSAARRNPAHQEALAGLRLRFRQDRAGRLGHRRPGRVPRRALPARSLLRRQSALVYGVPADPAIGTTVIHDRIEDSTETAMNPAEPLKDPVCGMTVTAAVAAPGRVRRPAGVLLLRRLQGEVRRRSAQVHAYRACRTGRGRGRRAGARGHRLHLPDASGGAPGPSRRLPEVRHGARAGNAEPRGSREPRADRLPPPLLVEPAGDARDHRARDVRPSPAG